MKNMAMSLDDDVPLILTLDESGSAPVAPFNGLGPDDLPSRSKMVGCAGGGGGSAAFVLLWAWWSDGRFMYPNT